MKVYKKKFDETDVYSAACDRIERLFNEFDRVVVSFSGGKDSTVCLNLCLEVARALGRTPLDVYFWDEEAIQPETVEYVRRVAALPDVDLKWLSVPIKHRNACSRTNPWWHPWHPEEKHLWVREMEEGSYKTIPGFKWGMSVPELAAGVYPSSSGRVADVRGLRADESLNRYRSVAKKLKDNWIGAPRHGYSYPVSPIYDWTTIDVWTAPKMFGWDYNTAYDLMRMAGMSPSDQRICPPFGDEPLKGLWIYAQCWPDLWAKMLNRVPGVGTAWRYAKTELYSYGDLSPPPGVSWRAWLFKLVEQYPDAARRQIKGSISTAIKSHNKKTGRPVPDQTPDPTTGLSWKGLAMVANRGDLKGRRLHGLSSLAGLSREKSGISIEESMELRYVE